MNPIGNMRQTPNYTRRPKSGNAAALRVGEPYLENLELNSRHFEFGLLYAENDWLR
jgi:hypothetical protein